MNYNFQLQPLLKYIFQPFPPHFHHQTVANPIFAFETQKKLSSSRYEYEHVHILFRICLTASKSALHFLMRKFFSFFLLYEALKTLSGACHESQEFISLCCRRYGLKPLERKKLTDEKKSVFYE